MGCGPAGTKGCCRQICSVQSDTGGEVWERGRAANLASCAERLLESWGYWMLGNCPGRMCLRRAEEINFWTTMRKESRT